MPREDVAAAVNAARGVTIAAVQELVLRGFVAVMEAPFSDRLVTAVFGPALRRSASRWARAESRGPSSPSWCS